MSHFLKHVACPKCGSSDARAIYSDGGSYCFSCQKPTSPNVSPYVKQYVEITEDTNIVLPYDATTNYSVDAVAWFTQYNITVETAKKRGLIYSAQRNQLLFTFYDADKSLLAYQARNLSPVSRGKRYFTQGDVNALLPIYHSTSPQRSLVLVEDCLSAIKLAGLERDAMPLLGSGISRQRLARLRPFYDLLEVWLDSDMWHKAQGVAKQAQLLGFQAKAVYSNDDPKCYTNQEIKEYLK